MKPLKSDLTNNANGVCCTNLDPIERQLNTDKNEQTAQSPGHELSLIQNGVANMGFGDPSSKGSHESVKYTELLNNNNNATTSMGDKHEMQNVGASNGSISNGSIPNLPAESDHLQKQTLVTKRTLYNQPEFDEVYAAGSRPSMTLRDTLNSCKENCECSGKCVKKKVTGLFPFLKIPMFYSMPEDFVSDLIAGLTVGIMQIPQGMAYATLASLPPEYGLYTSLFPVLMYAVLGSSRHVSVGTFAVVSLMVGSTVDRFDCDGKYGDSSPTVSPDGNWTLDGNWTDNMTTGAYDDTGSTSDVVKCKVAVAAAVTFVGGALQLLLGITRLGLVTIYLSEAMTRGFTTGCAIHVFSSQVKSVFGIDIQSYYGPWKLIYTYRDLFINIADTNIAALVLSIICMVIIWCTKEYLNPPVKKRIKAPIPIDLIIVILGTVVSAIWDFESLWDLPIVGDIPQGLPPPAVPDPELMVQVIADGIAVAIVAFAISVSMAQLFAKRHNYECDSNQELIAHGASNVVCANLNCYMMCVSLSRSVVCESLGCKSQINALWSGGLMLLVILFIASYFRALPSCVLASIIIVALKGMFMQFKDIPKYWKISKVDLSVWLVTFVAVVLLDVALGLVVGIAYSLLTVVGSTQRPYSSCEGQIDNTEIYKDLGVYSKAKELDGIKIFRFDGSIYFASKQYFIDSVYEKTDCDAKKIKIARGKIERKMKQEEKAREKARKKLEKQQEKAEISKGEVYKIGAVEEPITQWDIPQPNIQYLILDCTTIGYIDDSGCQGLRQVCSEYEDIGVTVYLAGCKAGVREMLDRGGFHDKFDKDILFPTVHDAVMQARNPPKNHPRKRKKFIQRWTQKHLTIHVMLP